MVLFLYFTIFYVSSLLFCEGFVIDKNEPLILTPFIEQGGDSIEEALQLSRVTPDIHGVKSYSGFLTIDKQCERNLFFWFFPAESDWESCPTVLWLNGGPRLTGVCAAFVEIGPWKIKDGKLVKREFAWTSKYNVIFLDQQVGMGFSFSRGQCHAKTVEEVTEGIYSGLTQLFTLFVPLQKNELIITGFYFLSYFGTGVAVKIDEENRTNAAAVKIKLKGVLIENPRTTPECHDISDQVFQLGIVDENGRRKLKDIHNQLIRKVKERKFSEADLLEKKILTELKLASELPSEYNYIADDQEREDTFLEFLTQSDITKQLHTGDIDFVTVNDNVFQYLLPEFFGSPNKYIEHLLKYNIIVGVYNGQLDIHSSYSDTLCFLNTLKWRGNKDFLNSKRYSWYLSKELVGWFKTSGTLFEVLVRKVGHYPLLGQNEVALKLIEAMFDSDSKDVLKLLKP